MLTLSRQLLTQSFLTMGYSPLDYLYLDEVTKLLTELNQEQFDQETFEELQNQCNTNSKGQIKLEDLMMTFIKAEGILVQREVEIQKIIKTLNEQLQEKMRNPAKHQAVISELEEELYEVREEQVSNNINLEIIRKPFIKSQKLPSPRTPRTPRTPRSAAVQQLLSPTSYKAQHLSVPTSEPLSINLSIANTHTFTWIFELSCLLLIISLPCMFYIPCYVNILLFLLIALNMISGYFCRYILRVWMYLVILSVMIDVVWYVVAAKSIWVGTRDHPNYVNSYIRLTLVLNCVVDIGKLILFVLLASEYNVDESERKVVSVFGLYEVELSHDEVQKNIFAVLNKGSGHGGEDFNEEGAY